MVSSGEDEIITEYALKSEESLRIALGLMYGCGLEIKRRIITNFLSDLEVTLRHECSGWLVENHFIPTNFERYASVVLRRELWGDQYKIAFEAQQANPRWIIIGIHKPETAAAIGGGSLKHLMDQRYMPGASNVWWEWYRKMDDGYDDWDNAATLMKLYRKDEAVAYFVRHPRTIAEIASPEIDKAVA